MQEISSEQQKQIMLDILIFVDKFCKENGIKYFLAGGTLIGAVRHKGFIPWDDDIDIALLREDYNKLLNTFNSISNGKYRLISRKTDKKYYLPYAKIIDTSTVLCENVHGVTEIGVNIDVFPFDYISDETAKNYNSIVSKTSLLEKIIAVKSIKLSKQRPFLKNAATVLLRGICPVPFWYSAVLKEKRMQKYAVSNPAKYVANFYGAWGAKEISETKNVLEVMPAEFEGHTFNIPTGYDAWLTNIYGDYMTPPPKEKQISHHDYTVYFK